jgi:mitochondrial import inner membrane translocase subunit TIM23
MLTATTSLPRLAALGARGHPLQTAISRGTACPYSSLATSPLASRSRAAPQSPKAVSGRSQGATQKPGPLQCQFVLRRQASTTTSGAQSPSPTLDWNSFFRLRKVRRRFQLASSLITTLVGGATGAMILVNQDIEWLTSKIPMDPYFSLGFMTLGFMGLGWLAGPSVGSAIFYLIKSGIKRPMAAKEAQFFARIKKNRADPTTSSVQNPGEFTACIAIE